MRLKFKSALLHRAPSEATLGSDNVRKVVSLTPNNKNPNCFSRVLDTFVLGLLFQHIFSTAHYLQDGKNNVIGICAALLLKSLMRL